MAFAYANLTLTYTHINQHAEAQDNIDRAAELGFERSSLEKEVNNISAAKVVSEIEKQRSDELTVPKSR